MAQVVLCTVPDESTAERLAKTLVEARVAACVNVVRGISSHYEWKGQLHADTELLLIIKTRLERFAELEALIQKNHPYEVPEIIALDVVTGATSYLDWVVAQTTR